MNPPLTHHLWVMKVHVQRHRAAKVAQEDTWLCFSAPSALLRKLLVENREMSCGCFAVGVHFN